MIFALQKAPIDPFTKEQCKPTASQGVPLGGMGYVFFNLENFLCKCYIS